MLRVALSFTLATVIPAHAETRVTLRFGIAPLELEASRDTPLFGDDVMGVIDQVNGLATAYERTTGRTMPRLDTRDVDIDETLFVVAPGLEFGGAHFYLRIEAPAGFADDLTTAGIGIYPINVQARMPAGPIAYISLGGTASWLDRPGGGDVGALFTARAAAGARFAGHLSFEVGVNAFAIGGSINNQRLVHLTRDDLPRPEQLAAGGEARGLVDVSLGVTF